MTFTHTLGCISHVRYICSGKLDSKTEPACLVLYVLADCHCPLFILCFCLSAAVAAAHAAALLPYLTGLPWIHQ